MEIMGSRYKFLEWAVEGYQKSGVPLVGFDGTKYLPGGSGDDIGLYYFVPKLMQAFGLDVDAAINLFYYGWLLISLAIGATGTFVLFRKWSSRLVMFAALALLCALPVRDGDSYTLFSCVAVAVIPWAIFWMHRLDETRGRFFLILSGVIIGLSHFIRSHAGTGVALFLLILVFLDRGFRFRTKLISTAALAIGILIPTLFFNVAISKRDVFLKETVPNYEAGLTAHPFWHSVFMGLLYINDPHEIPGGSQYLKTRGPNNPQPGLPYTPESEFLAKKEVIQTIISHPYFFVRNLFAKFGVMFFYLLFFGNIGLLLSIKHPLEGRLTVALAGGAAFNTVFGFLVTPYHFYVLGFIAMVLIYNATVIATYWGRD